MGNDNAREVGLEKAAVTIEDSMDGVTDIVCFPSQIRIFLVKV